MAEIQSWQAGKHKERMQSESFKEESESCSLRCCLSPLSPLLGSPKSLVRTQTQNSAHVSGTFQYDFATATTSSLYPHTEFTNHESLPDFQESFCRFVRAYPQYLNTVEADHIRAQYYSHLSLRNHVCLDYFGYGLFSYGQQQVPDDPAASVATSSSTTSPSSSYPGNLKQLPFFETFYKPVNLRSQIVYDSSHEAEFEGRFRTRIMQFLNKSEDDYSMVFTANPASAFKLLAESYPFATHQTLLTVYDHKNEAVESMIESSKKQGAKILQSQFKWPKMKIKYEKLKEMIVSNKKKKHKRGLFVFPLQSRVTGAKYSYQWMSMAQEHGWHVLVDANALGAKDMDTLGLSIFQPDFLICTFYKVFGENPSGFSCLFVKKCSSSVLDDTTIATGMGTVTLVPSNPTATMPEISDQLQSIDMENKQNEDLPTSSVPEAFHRTADRTSSSHHEPTEFSNRKQKQPMQTEIEELETDHHEQTESSNTKQKRQMQTENEELPHMQQKDAEYSEIKCKGLDHADSLGLLTISTRVRYLINWLIKALLSLRHPYSETAFHLVTIYGPKIRFDRAPNLAFNVFDWRAERIDPILVQKLADRNNISVSVEFITNMWVGDRYDEETSKIMEKRLRDKEGRITRKQKKIKMKNNGDYGISVVTISIGFLNSFEDVYKFWAFVSRFLDADFVEKQRWRYAALNQKTIEV